uniref:AIG1-type G domain-containing protein n=1 Tax=Elphidium margaritaceum TaxID=933848 RepID=A0A7S0XMR8_9EUKA|mmetsp:Transcript_2407/g.4675  ORF Transcript_2407/g.4675 Transcript_2407/m.4675 type:complete len:947 (+) Transcript_2407:185-3025(+)
MEESHGSDEGNSSKMNKTLMFIGETGTGKTTTINSMMNYLYNAEFHGHRYELIAETFGDKQASDSQTSDVTLYYINPSAIDFQLTVIDTPGFGDTKGLEFDKRTTDTIKRLFETKVTEIDVIFFVIRASQSRLTERQKYVFNEILNIFGNDIADNIILLFTFGDVSTPVALTCVKDANLPHRKNFVKINNSAFAFGLNEQNHSLFDSSVVRFAELFEEIETIETKSLQLTRQVLAYRNNLKRTLANLKRKLDDGLLVLETFKERIEYIEKHKDEINSGSSDQMATIFVPQVTKTIEKQVLSWWQIWKRKMKDEENQSSNKRDQIQSQDHLKTFVVCQTCKYTCQDLSKLNVLESYNVFGECYLCPQHCTRQHHERVKYKYESCLVEKKVPIKKLDNGYYDASLDQPRSDQLIQTYTAQLKECERDLIEMIMKMRVYLNKIKKLALNKQTTTPLDYIEDMIRAEETQRKKGYEQRVKALQSIEQQQELLNRISADVDQRDINSLFPEFEELYKYHEKEEQKEQHRNVQRVQHNDLVKKSELDRSKTVSFRDQPWYYFFKQQIYNRTYDDFLLDFQGHIIETDEVDRSELFSLKEAQYMAKLSAALCGDNNNRAITLTPITKIYALCKNKNYNYFVSKNGSGPFSNSVRWTLVYPKKENKNAHDVYLVFKCTTDLVELIENVLDTPHKLCTDDKKKADLVSVHRAIYLALMKQFDGIFQRLEKLKIGTAGCKYPRLSIGGHSIGGSLAILLGYELIRREWITEETLKHTPVSVVTFGAPPVMGLYCDSLESIESDKRVQLLDSLCHCFINRLDPVPRIMTLMSNIPKQMQNALSEMIKKKLGWYTKYVSNESTKSKITAAIERAPVKELKKLYFSVGKQYIWCGKAEKWYMDEQLKVRVKRNVVSTFDEQCEYFKAIPCNHDVWVEMFDDHQIKQYQERLDGRSTLVD